MVRATSKTSAPAPVVSASAVDTKKPVAKKPSAPKTSEKKAPEPVQLEISIPETPVESEVSDKSSIAALLLEEKNQAHANFQLIMNTVAALKINMKNIDKMTSRVMKDAAKSTKHKKKSSGLSGFEKPTLISDELALFFGKDKDTKMARTEVSKLIHEYVKKENLQKEGNRRVIRPDNKLQKLLVIDASKEELTYFNLQKYLKKHFRKEVV
jgi:chromatin remodeling complex protein RSC6